MMGTNRPRARGGQRQQRQGLSPHRSVTLGQRLRRLPLVRVLGRGGQWRRSDGLALVGVVLAVVAVVVGGLQLKAQDRGNQLALASATTAAPHSQLVASAVAVARSQDIDATVDTRGMGGPPQTTVSTSVIDVTLRNTGSQPALITRADFSFRWAAEIENCVGAGPGSVSARYDVKVPTDPKVTSHPFVVHRDMRFVVNANAIDRLAFTVGPETFLDSDWPWIYDIDVSLHQDTGVPVPVGRVVLLEPVGGPRWDWLRQLPGAKADFECFERIVALLQAAVRAPGMHSPELVAFDQAVEKLTQSP